MEASKERASAVLGAGARGHAQRRAARLQQEEQAKQASVIQAQLRGRRERIDPTAESNVRRARSEKDPAMQSAAYLEQHKIIPLLELLAQKLLIERPADPRAYLVGELQALHTVADPASPRHFFSDSDIETLFQMYSVANSRGLMAGQCREALDALGLQHVATPPAPVDLAAFKASIPAI